MAASSKTSTASFSASSPGSEPTGRRRRSGADARARLKLRPVEDSHLFFLEDAGVFYSHADQEIHAFNAAAAFVWCCLEEGIARAEIQARLGERFQRSDREARADVDTLLGAWLERGWVRDREAAAQPLPGRSPKPSDSRDPGPSLAPWPRHPAPLARGSSRRQYQLLDTGFELRAPDEVARRVHPTLAHLETTGSGARDALFDVVARGGEWILYENGVEVERCGTPEGLAPMVKGELWRVAVNRHRFFMEIHAGAVERFGRCILLPGAPGSGKSTLTAALVAAGFTLFSDETALLEEADLGARAVPLSLTIKSGAVELLAPAFPHLPELPEHARQDGRIVRYLSPPRGSLPAPTRQVAPVGALVFPRVGPVSQLERIPRIDGLQRLLAECVVLPELLSVAKVRALVGWMRRVDCYDLSSGPLRESIATIEALASAWAAETD